MKTITAKQLQQAVKKAPKEIHQAGMQFIRDGVNQYYKKMVEYPWRVGMSGGGVPIKYRGLLEAHIRDFSKIRSLEGRVYVDPNRQANKINQKQGIKKVIDYAIPVHSKRPWLDWTKENSDKKIESLYGKFGDKVLKIIAT